MTITALLRGRGENSIISVSPDMPVYDVLALLADKRIGAVPVLDNEQLVGIMSERDMIYGIRREGPAFLDRRVSEAMTRAVITVTGDTSPLEALAMMTQRRIRHLPVIDDGVLIGFVSIGDLVKVRMERIESEAAAMRENIQAV